ncbi:MAG TPA: hypothetical protein VFU22_12150, partial [Roseiflexaceae bacterium]|nr:hypothetical protein [Roseiflexaceae bacterium]
MLLRSARLVSRLLLLVMVWSWLPQAAIAAPLPAEPTPPVGGALGSPPAAAPVPIVTQPIPKQLPPGLAIELSVAPDPLAIGETATISVTITNRSPYPAEALDVSVPTPDGALALPGPSMLGPQQGWRWTTRLEGNRSTTLTGQLQLVRNPNGDALLLT